MSDITKIMEAYLGMVSEPQSEETLEEAVNMGPWNRGAINKAMSKAGIKGSQAKAFIAALRVSGTVDEEVETELDEVSEKKLDPVDDKENDKKFKDRKDKDIDNDGDVDSSDEYLHKKRAATDDAIDGGKKPAKKEEVEKDEEESEEEPKDKKKKPFPPKKKDDDSEEEPDAEPEADGDSDIKKNPKTADKKAEISKIESVEFRSAFEEMWSAFAEAADPKKGALAGEKYDDHSSEHDKKVIAMHKKSDKKYEDDEEDGHTKTFKAGGKDMKQSPARSGADNLSNGDKTPVK